MSQFTELRDLCNEFGLDTEVAYSPADSGEGDNFEIIVDFASGQVEPERAIAEVEDEFDLVIYDADMAKHDHTLTGEYTLAISD